MSTALTADDVLGPQGELSRTLAGYEHRPEQLAMAREVARTLRERGTLLAEAGTGTGKTLAYLVPAVLSRRKVVVATATKTLQEQVFFKDVPLLQDGLGLRFKAAYLKGRSNYLCAHRFESFEREPLFASSEEAKHWPALRDWAYSTQTGDRAELDLPDLFLTWNRLSTTSDTCLGSKCPLYESCFVTRHRRAAEEADVVVVNHHLFFADLQLRSPAGREREVGVLPRYEAVVFDEAHALEDVATEHFGMQVSSFRLDELAQDALKATFEDDEQRRGMVQALGLALRGRAQAFFRAVPQVLGLSAGEQATRLQKGRLLRLQGSVAEVLESLKALQAATRDADPTEVKALARRSDELATELTFITEASSADHVYWAEARGKGTFLRAAPIDVAAELQRRLYSQVDTVVFTSATLTAQGEFDFFARRMGVESPRTLAVDSPFDHARQSALYVPSHLPEPNAPGFAEAVADELLALTDITSGRAFALFTSLRQMAAVHALAAPRLRWQVLLQGSRPKRALLEAFRAEPSVLFASHSFWEGVDVPGDALSLVVIDRLPFASPGDPLEAARIERLRHAGENAFEQYQLPRAALALRQGVGRLIRTTSDRGVLALLDKRLLTQRYGAFFLESLPPSKRVATREALASWFRRSG